MRRIVLLITICCQVFWVAAQKKAPKWMDKQRKAVVTVTTYGKDNQKKASGTGFFITETGEALSGYSLFKDAARATVTDADGKEYPVSRILGADELYDVIKFKVARYVFGSCELAIRYKETCAWLASAGHAFRIPIRL